MSGTVVQRSAANPGEYGLADKVHEATPPEDAAQQSMHEAMHEVLRAKKDPESGAQAQAHKSASPSGKASQPSTLDRVQLAMSRQAGAHIDSAPVSGKSAAPASSTGDSARMLTDRYDGGKTSINYTNDQRTATQLAQSMNLSLTGLPPAEVKDEQAIAGLAPQLAQMDESTREGFTARAMNLLQQPPAQRHAAIAALRSDVSREVAAIEKDPVRRLAAMFNAPVGAEYLQDGGRAQMSALRAQFEAFVAPGGSDAAHSGALHKAVQIKTQMQTAIREAVTSHTGSEQRAWGESAQRIERILSEAEQYNAKNIRLPKYTDDPQWNDKRTEAYAQTYGYQSIGEKLLSNDGLSHQERDNPGWWHGPGMQRTPQEKARDLLSFQQAMNDPTSAIFKRVNALETRATHELSANGDKDHYLDQVGVPRRYSDIGKTPPRLDENYVQNLAQQYLDTTKDVDAKSRQMMREHTPDTLDKVLYATGKVLNSLMPLPGLDWMAGQLLDAAIPNHGGLSRNQVAALDTTLMVGGLLLGGVDRLPMRKDKFGLDNALETKLGGLHPAEGQVPPSLPAMAKERIAKSFGVLTNEPLNPSPGRPQGATPGAGHAKSGRQEASVHGDGLSIPSSYEEPRPQGQLDWRKGVFVDKRDDQHIEKGGHWYKVKYDADNGTLRVVHPNDGSKPAYPVRIGPDGSFEVHGDVGLKGGAPRRAPREMTPELQQEMRRLALEGKTHQEIADRLNLPLGQVRQFAREEAARWSRPRLTADQERQIKADLENHMSVEEVVARTGASKATVYRFAKKLGIALSSTNQRVPINTRQRAVDMLYEGLSHQQISDGLGITAPTIGKIAREYQVVARHGYNHIAPADLQRAKDMVNSGTAPATVADKLGIPSKIVYAMAYRYQKGPHPLPSDASDMHQQIVDRLNRGEPPTLVAREFNLTPASVHRIANRNRMQHIMTGELDRMGPEALDALAANLNRRASQASGSPQPVASAGGETSQPAAKRARLETEGSHATEGSGDTDELIPQYIDRLFNSFTPEQLSAAHDMLDDAFLRLEADKAKAGAHSGATGYQPPGSPQPGTSTGGLTGPVDYRDLDPFYRQLYEDIEGLTDISSDEEVSDFVAAWDREMNPKQ